ncbi:hypothetical protein ACJ72_02124 [Emergomyces africanus]|uniref:Fibronectin type-III domain-containing protein n=1 Tax=Emergomyces africanus TaxID=1955775 RepID=A0A1B7P3C3_9EURO|nr:hypothetical protein ACJ72_02124 [Emergomyces africanus]
MFLRGSELFLALMLTAPAFTSASAIFQSQSRPIRISFGEGGPCSITTEDSYVSVLKCEKHICLSSPVLDNAGCCEPDGCFWRKSCLPHGSVEGHSSDGPSDTMILPCSGPTRKYCQFATFRNESTPDSEYFMGTCALYPHQPDLKFDLLPGNSGCIVSQTLENNHSYQLRVRAMSHELSKRETGSVNSRTVTIIGCLIGFCACVLIACCAIGCRRKSADSEEVPAPAAVATNSTSIYVMNPAAQQPGVQSPPLAYTYPPGQVPDGQTQTIYIQGPPPPGAQLIQLTQAPGPIPQPHPSYSTQPPPAYHK